MISGEDHVSVPICSLALVVIDTVQVRITSYLINRLTQMGVKIVFCNDRHQPQSEMISLVSHHAQSGNIQKQINWQQSIKDELWKEIIKEKISMQIQLHKKISINPTDMMERYCHQVKPSDKTNREGQASRLHFNMLFGHSFVRHEKDDINAALNYGYAIIHAAVNRFVVLSGYISNIGIKHSSTKNPFNLSYDFIEPFRPLVDEIVHQRKSLPFDREYKKLLVEILYMNVKYGGRKLMTMDAIQYFVRDCFQSLNKSQIKIKRFELL